MIEDGKTGYLIEPGNVKQFEDKLIYLLKNCILLVKMGKKAKEIVRQRFMPKVVAGNIKGVIDRFCEYEKS